MVELVSRASIGRRRLRGRVAATLGAAMLFGAALANPLDDATAAYRRGDYATAYVLLQPLADAGDRAAQHNLGVYYAVGQGDYAEAGSWFRRAADQGLADAQFNLGVLYASGRGVPQDYREAAMWYRKAASQGHPLAQLNLGAIYANGQGIPRDYVEAHKWFNLAASSLPESQAAVREVALNDRERAARKLTPAQIAEAQKLARAWQPD